MQLASPLNMLVSEGERPVHSAHSALLFGNAAGAEQAHNSGGSADRRQRAYRKAALLESLGLELLTGPNFRSIALVTKLLDDSADAGLGRKFYSQLSGSLTGRHRRSGCLWSFNRAR